MGKRCVSLRSRPIISTTGYSWYYPAAFLPRRKHASTFMYSICPRELWVIPNGRIVSASRGYCPIRDSPSADDRTGSDWALLKATRVRFADMCSSYIDSTFRICRSASSRVDGNRQREFLSWSILNPGKSACMLSLIRELSPYTVILRKKKLPL